MSARYVRIAWDTPSGERRTAWARAPRQSGSHLLYSLVDRNGEALNEILVAAPGECAVRAAHMSLKYAVLVLGEEVTS